MTATEIKHYMKETCRLLSVRKPPELKICNSAKLGYFDSSAKTVHLSKRFFQQEDNWAHKVYVVVHETCHYIRDRRILDWNKPLLRPHDQLFLTLQSIALPYFGLKIEIEGSSVYPRTIRATSDNKTLWSSVRRDLKAGMRCIINNPGGKLHAHTCRVEKVGKVKATIKTVDGEEYKIASGCLLPAEPEE